MSLNFNYASVTNHETVTTHPEDLDKPLDKQRLSPITDAIVWGLMAIGMPKITEENLDKVWLRFYAMERITGASLHFDGGPVYMTYEDLREHIGLTTNVSPEKDTMFKAKLMRWAETSRPRKDAPSLRAQLTKAVSAAKEGV